MSTEQMRVAKAIARAVGLKNVRVVTDHSGTHLEHGEYPDAMRVPDYPADLNAMHEAEKVLKPGQRNRYNMELRAICADIDVWHATALQRATAFCATLNLKPEGET